MQERFSRTELLLGEERMERLKRARVAVFGVGGVGGYVVEALARSGVGTLDLIDNDTVCESNINRQIIATEQTIGRYKVDVAKERILSINPEASVNCHALFYMPDTAEQFDFTKYDYVVDAIDTVTGKLELVMQAERAGTPIISSMGAGNKMDAAAFRVADIYKTNVCPLAKVMRRELKKRGIKKLKVVYSEEKPMTPIRDTKEQGENLRGKDMQDKDVQDKNLSSEGNQGKDEQNKYAQSETVKRETGSRRQTPGSIAFVPSVVGLILAGEVIKDLTGWENI